MKNALVKNELVKNALVMTNEAPPDKYTGRSIARHAPCLNRTA